MKMDLKEIWCKDVDWINSVQDKFQWGVLVKAVMNLQVGWNPPTPSALNIE
jgi:hypothetical protein